MRKSVTEKGFTLVELAIVMVIIGLMIGAVLKGQAMIDDAKQKRLMSDLQGISAAYFTYYDRYSAIPGDDTSNHGWAGVTAGSNGNGYIGGNNVNDGTEAHEAWQALRYAGLLSGDPAATDNAHLPGHPFGGKYYLGNTDFGSGIGRKNRIMCNNLPGSIAEIIDIKFDDGVYNSGSVRANNAYTTANVNLFYAL